MKKSLSWLILTVASVCICLASASKASTYSLTNKDLLASYNSEATGKDIRVKTDTAIG